MIETGTVTAVGGLNMRQKATVNSPIVDTLPFGTMVDIDSHEGNWLHVSYNFKSGYLYKDYVKVLAEPPPKNIDLSYDLSKRPWEKTIIVLVIAIVAAIIAFSYGSLGWRP